MKESSKSHLRRISMSLPNTLLDQFDKSMKNAGFADKPALPPTEG